MNEGTAQTQQNDDVVPVALPSNLLAQIDAQVGSAFVDREDFIRSAVRSYLEHIRVSQGTAPNDIG